MPGLAVPSTAVWKGDATVACIAAASILAKVTRDAIMTDLHERFPDYDFAKHKGYVTSAHAAGADRPRARARNTAVATSTSAARCAGAELMGDNVLDEVGESA